MNYRQVSRKLRRLGCEFDEQGKGSHEIWRNPTTTTKATIPNWGAKDLKPGTIAAILRELKINRSDFNQA